MAEKNMFYIRFDSVVSFSSATGNGVLVVDNKYKDEFFSLADRFQLRVEGPSSNGVYCVEPAESTKEADLRAHISTWDITFHKFFACANEFRRELEKHVSITIVSKVDPTHHAKDGNQPLIAEPSNIMKSAMAY